MVDLENWPNCATPDCENKSALLGIHPGRCYPCNVALQGKEATDAQYRAAFGEQWGRCECDHDDVTLGCCWSPWDWPELHCHDCCENPGVWTKA